MRRSPSTHRGFSLTELIVALAIVFVVFMIGWVTWEMFYRGMVNAQATSQAYQEAFALLRRVEVEIKRAALIKIPDPDFPNVPSIELWVPDGGVVVRRAFRFDSTRKVLVIDLNKDQPGTFNAFMGVSALSFSFDPPSSSTLVRVSCTTTTKGQTVQMETLAMRRN